MRKIIMLCVYLYIMLVAMIDAKLSQLLVAGRRARSASPTAADCNTTKSQHNPVEAGGSLIFSAFEENLSQAHNSIHELSHQFKNMMDNGGVPVFKQSIDFLRLWQMQSNRFWRSFSYFMG